MTGMDYSSIAAKLGYANRGTAWNIVQRALKSREVDAVEDYRELAFQRLEALLKANWSSAVQGDVKAAMVVLKVVEAERRLLALDQKDGRPTGPVSIVVGDV